jgi:hypothetical protein
MFSRKDYLLLNIATNALDEARHLFHDADKQAFKSDSSALAASTQTTGNSQMAIGRLLIQFMALFPNV